MLRKVLLWFAALLLAGGGAACWLTASHVGLGPAMAGALLLAALVVERHGYQRIRDSVPGPDWDRTGEEFVDPASGVPVVVYFQRRTGKRASVRAGPAVSRD